MREAMLTGAWRRLKACPADDCQWAFYDRSRNRSRTWCKMDVCGNRSKVRTFRERRSPELPPPVPPGRDLWSLAS